MKRSLWRSQVSPMTGWSAKEESEVVDVLVRWGRAKGSRVFSQ